MAAQSHRYSADALLAKLNVDDGVFDRDAFLTELGRTASRDELRDFAERTRRSCTTLQTERIAFINDSYADVIDAIQSLNTVLREDDVYYLLQMESTFEDTCGKLTALQEQVDELNGDMEHLLPRVNK